MTSPLQLAYYALWAAHPALQLSVAGVLWWRKLHRAFPVFFAYLISQIVTFAILFPVYQWGGYGPYFYSYWICQAISLALGFEVIHEVFLDVFKPYHALKDLGTVLFKWAALVMLLVAGVVAAASPAGQQGPLVQAVLTVQRCIRVIQCGLILFLLVFSKYLGVSWRQHGFGIALGFGSFASMELTLVALNASGHASQIEISIANMVGYNVAILIWLGYAVRKSPLRDLSNLLMSQRWDQSLTDLQHPAAGDSLIPMFEHMVDRAFSRTHPDAISEEAQSTEPFAFRAAAAAAASKGSLPRSSEQLPSKT